MKKTTICFCLIVATVQAGLTQNTLAGNKKILEDIADYIGIRDSVSTQKSEIWSKWLTTGQDKQQTRVNRIEAFKNLYKEVQRIYSKGNGVQVMSSLGGIEESDATFVVQNDILLTGYKKSKSDLTPANSPGKIQRFGQGEKTLLLLPGIGYDYTVFNDLINTCSSQYSIYCITYPGIAGVPAYARPTKLAIESTPWFNQLSDAIVASLKKENRKEIIIVANGSASFISTAIAKKMTNVTGIVLVNGIVSYPVAGMMQTSKPIPIEMRRKIVLAVFPHIEFNIYSQKIKANNNLTIDSVKANKYNEVISNKTDVFAYNTYLRELQLMDLGLMLADIKIPVLAVNSIYDELSPSAGNTTLLQTWQRLKSNNLNVPITTYEIRNARSLGYVDKPAEFMQLLSSFVSNPLKPIFPSTILGPELITLSPAASVSQVFANTLVEVKYYCPAAKGRKVVGGLVPYGKVWRAGANESTIVKFSRDVFIEGKLLKKGEYSFFVKPFPEKWVAIFNRIPNQWGAFTYDSTYDELRADMQIESSAMQEYLKYSFESITSKSAELTLNWENTKASLRIAETFMQPTAPDKIKEANWQQILSDKEKDGVSPGLSDAKELAYYYDKERDSLWFKFTLYNRPNPNAMAMNLLIDTDANQQTGTKWFGKNTAYTFERMITMWVRREGDGYKGTVGMADENGVAFRQYTNVAINNITYFLGMEENAYYIGIKRSDISPGRKKFNIIGAVGEYTTWNDDISDSGFATIELK